MPMDICSHIGLAASDSINDHHGVLKPLSVDELSVDVTKFLNIQDPMEEDSSSNRKCEFQKKDLCDKFLHSQIMTQSPKKHASFSGKTIVCHQDVNTSELSTHGDNIKSSHPSSISTHLKPVSAMKGSREKRGATPPVKLTVKWAPDVYDPIPTSASHVVTNRSSKHSKKNSKKQQKNGSKSSRGSKSKDKKKVRKHGGTSSSSVSYKFEDEEELVDFKEHEHQPGGIDFKVGNSDRLCGSSFMKRCGTSLHISSVAEAT